MNRKTNLLRDTPDSAPHPDPIRAPAPRHSAGQALAQFSAVVLILLIYSYPSLRARSEFGGARLPPIFAPDLSLYLNLSSVRTVSPGKVLNPYYLLPVPANSTAYLKFHLGAALFNSWNNLLARRMWLAMFLWNIFWWGLLCAIALWLFARFLPTPSSAIGIAGLGLLMLLNIGMARPLLSAWLHLPSLAGFQSVALPFMRAFTPQIPIPLLLGYLGLQMAALRKTSLYPWLGMGVLQLLALSVFPYATLMMAGISFASALFWMFSPASSRSWPIPLTYAAVCAIADAAFLMRGSLNVYASHASPINFQPQLLPHLTGGAWLLLCLLTLATAFSKTLPPEVKWPLAGLGGTNAVLMLGDAVVPSTVLLLSVHAGYFAHTTVAVLLTFLAAAALLRMPTQPNRRRIAVAVALVVFAANGILLSLGAYRAFLPLNRQQAEVASLLISKLPVEGELFIARSRFVDDACGWVALLSKEPVLFCTDAEVMLTPQQNQDVHRFRQALYLYFSGKDSAYLQRIITDPNPAGAMYQLGFWAEAASFSAEERKDGIRGIQTDLMPQLARVEGHDPAVSEFFRQFTRIIVMDDLQDPTFSPARLGSFLKLEDEQHFGHWVLLSYVPQ